MLLLEHVAIVMGSIPFRAINNFFIISMTLINIQYLKFVEKTEKRSERSVLTLCFHEYYCSLRLLKNCERGIVILA